METLEKPIAAYDVNGPIDLHVNEDELASYLVDFTLPIPARGKLTPNTDNWFTAITTQTAGISVDHWKWIAGRFTAVATEGDVHTFTVVPDSLFVLEHDQKVVNGAPCALQESDAGKYWADTRSGEFVAYVVPEGFRVDSLEAFNWVMRKMLTVESQIKAVEGNADVIAAKAIVANAEAMRKRLYSRYESLENFFGPDLGEFARVQLEGKKERTFYSELGSVQLRKKAGGLKVLDEEKAIELCKEHLNDKGFLKVTEKFLISGLTPEQKAIITTNIDQWDGFFVEPASETVTIKTGIVKE